jgi:4-aminobutyrate aminotransferase/(S)-3-amino-2-methylpropionate transaminase
MEEQDLAAAATKIGAVIGERLRTLQADNPGIGDVRGRGAMMAMELVRPGTDVPDPDAAKRIVAACHRAGVITLSCGSYGNVVRLLPPLIIEAELLDDGLSVLAAAVNAEL